MFKNVKNLLTKKVINCPQCSKKLRVPIRPGKTLRVNCAGCHCQFDINFRSPLSQLFNWSKGRSLSYNLKSIWLSFKALPFQAKTSLFLTTMLLFVLLHSIISALQWTSPVERPVKAEKIEVQDIDNFQGTLKI